MEIISDFNRTAEELKYIGVLEPKDEYLAFVEKRCKNDVQYAGEV